MSSTTSKWTSRQLLVLATVVVALTFFIPYGQFLIYPIALFGTFIHEASHALAAVMSGGKVLGMHVNLDTSGLTKTMGGVGLLISSAGYLGSVLAGAAFLLAGRRRKWAKRTLMVAGSLTLLFTGLFGGYGSKSFAVGAMVGGFLLLLAGRKMRAKGKPWIPFVAGGGLLGVAALAYLSLSGALLTWVIGLVMGGGLLLAGLYLRPIWQQLLVLFLGVQLALDGLSSLKSLWIITTQTQGHSDAVNMARMTGVPATLWAALWGLVAVLMLIGTFWIFWRDSRRSVFARGK